MEKDHTNAETAMFTYLLRVAFHVTLIAIFLYILFSNGITNHSIPKKDLVDVYGIDKKSFNKWVKYFCQDVVPDLEVYKRKRTVSLCEYLLITFRLGTPDDHPILTKKEIINLGDGSYRSLRESIHIRPCSFGLPSYTAFRKLQKFPPIIGKRILEQYM